MQLWGSSVDASKAVPWKIPRPFHRPSSAQDEESEEAETETTTDIPEPTPEPEPEQPVYEATKSFAKPTDHLPEDHGDAPGEAESHFGDPDLPTATPTADPVPGEGTMDSPTIIPVVDDTVLDGSTVSTPGSGESGGYFDFDTPGYLSGMSNLLSSSTWMFVAGGTILVFVAGVTAFFVLRRRPRLGRGGGYDFAPQTDEEDGLPMSALDRRGRLSLNAPGSARTRELYDAFRLDSDDEDEDERDSDEVIGKPHLGSGGAYTDDAVSLLGYPFFPAYCYLIVPLNLGSFWMIRRHRWFLPQGSPLKSCGKHGRNFLTRHTP